MNPPDATAIVVTYNSADHIAACLTALRATVPVRVVDNASSDGTADLVATRFPDVRLTANTGNVGFAAAVNQALAGVRTDAVVLVNPDCVVGEGTVRALVDAVVTRPGVGIAAPRLVGPQGRVAVSAHPFETWLTVLASRFGGSLVPPAVRRTLSGARRRKTYDACARTSAPTPVDWVSGACLAVRTSLLRQTGGLDEGYFMYYEDEELCLQARRLGAEVLYLPTVRAVHIGGASSTDPTQVWPHLYRSMLRFFARHRRRSYPLVRAIVALRALLGAGMGLARLPLRPAMASARVRAWLRILRLTATVRFSAAELRQPPARPPLPSRHVTQCPGKELS